MKEKNLINFYKAAEFLDTSYDFVYNLTVLTNEIPFVDFGKNKPKRVYKEDIENYINARLVKSKGTV